LNNLSRGGNIMIKNYLEAIQSRRGKKNSPTFAWEVVHNQTFPGNRMGRYPGPAKEKVWKGMKVDAAIKNRWLDQLNNIPNVEIRASCSGHPADKYSEQIWVSYVVFRVAPKLDKNIKKIVKKLNSFKDVNSGYDIGMEGRPRIVAATKLHYGGPNQSDWVKWWNSIASKINNAVNS